VLKQQKLGQDANSGTKNTSYGTQCQWGSD